MDNNAVSTLIATIISGIIAFLVCKWQMTKNNIFSEEARLSEQLFNILKIQIEYPYLEFVKFTEEWDRNTTNDKVDYQRYESYCCMLFNFIGQIFRLYKGNESKIENFFAVSEEVTLHKKWWQNPSNPRDNIDGYDMEFVKYIDSVIGRKTK